MTFHGFKRFLFGAPLLVGAGLVCPPVEVHAETVLIDLGRIEALESALRERGWKVERDPQGALLLYPKGAGTETKTPGTPAPAKTQSPPETGTPGEWVPMTDLDGLQRALQMRGWRVERKDGDLLVYPAAASTAPTEAKEQPASVTAAPVEIDARDLDTLQAVAAQRGWGQRREADGGLVLYPLVAEASAGTAGCQSGMVRVTGIADGELPIDSWTKARAVAQRWVVQHDASRSAIGKIRQVNDLYLVSLTEPEAPHRLRSQLVIRAADGCAIAIPR